jgi:hypothetical protein
MDLEFDDPRPRYRLCQLGFGLIALALALLSFDTACTLGLIFTRNPGIQNLLGRKEWIWLVSAPITWGSLIGSYLLWGRWTEVSWQRRAGGLLLMNSVDAVIWAMNHAQDLGLAENQFGYPQLRREIAACFGWLEFMLIASLATDLSSHLGKHDAPDAGRSARSFAVIGLALWCVELFMMWAQWTHIVRPRRVMMQQRILLSIGSVFLTALTSFQVTVLCIAASRQCKRFVKELDWREWDHDLLKSRSESEKDEGPESPTGDWK